MPSPELAQQNDVHDLYCDHHGWLYNWLRNRVGCSHGAADLAQDTYLRVLMSGKTPPAGQSRPHLMQIAKGLVIDRYRRQLIEKAYLDTLALQPEVYAPSPEESAQALEALVRIDVVLHKLKPKVRETFLLSRFDGLTYHDIAARMGISQATVRKYMLLALQACMTAMVDDNPEPRHE